MKKILLSITVATVVLVAGVEIEKVYDAEGNLAIPSYPILDKRNLSQSRGGDKNDYESTNDGLGVSIVGLKGEAVNPAYGEYNKLLRNRSKKNVSLESIKNDLDLGMLNTINDIYGAEIKTCLSSSSCYAIGNAAIVKYTGSGLLRKVDNAWQRSDGRYLSKIADEWVALENVDKYNWGEGFYSSVNPAGAQCDSSSSCYALGGDVVLHGSLGVLQKNGNLLATGGSFLAKNMNNELVPDTWAAENAVGKAKGEYVNGTRQRANGDYAIGELWWNSTPTKATSWGGRYFANFTTWYDRGNGVECKADTKIARNPRNAYWHGQCWSIYGYRGNACYKSRTGSRYYSIGGLDNYSFVICRTK